MRNLRAVLFIMVAIPVSIAARAQQWTALNCSDADEAARSGGTIHVTAGHFLCTRTLTITKQGVHIVGEGRDSTVLQFPADSAGIRCVSTEGCNNLKISDLTILGSNVWNPQMGSVPTGSGDGIFANVTVQLERIAVESFSRHGINIDTSGGGNANEWYMANVSSWFNRGNGFNIAGGDSQIGACINCAANDNQGWGFEDLTSYGNVYIGPHVMFNGSGGYHMGAEGNQITTGVLIHPYSEGSQVAKINPLWKVFGMAGGFLNFTDQNHMPEVEYGPATYMYSHWYRNPFDGYLQFNYWNGKTSSKPVFWRIQDYTGDKTLWWWGSWYGQWLFYRGGGPGVGKPIWTIDSVSNLHIYTLGEVKFNPTYMPAVPCNANSALTLRVGTDNRLYFCDGKLWRIVQLQ